MGLDWFSSNSNSNFNYFTTITKSKYIQLLFIMLVGTDVCARMVFVWEDTNLPDVVTTFCLVPRWAFIKSYLRTIKNHVATLYIV